MGCCQGKGAKAAATRAATPPPSPISADGLQLADWPQKDEVLRVFALADKDTDGLLDMKELSDVRNSPEMAEAMMGKVDKDLSGNVSEEEWCLYFMELFEKNEKSAAAVLSLYERQIKANRSTLESDIGLVAKPVVPTLDSPETTKGCCWCNSC